MRQLEKRVGGALFERIGRRSVATDLGRSLARQGLVIRNAEAEARTFADLIHLGQAGKLSIGSTPTLADNLLVPVISEFLTAHENAHIDLRVGIVDELEELLATGAIDLVLGPVDPWRHKGTFDIELMADDVIGVLCNAEHTLLGAKRHSPGDLEKQRWIAHSRGSYLRFQTEDALSKFGVRKMDIALETDSTESAFKVAMRTDFITVMPRLPFEKSEFQEHLVFIDLGNTAFHRPIGLINRSTHIRSKIEARFMKLLQRRIG